MKKTFYSEAAYFLGTFLLALSAALMERADMGMSMIVAPAYLLHLKVSRFLPWFSFGVAEYAVQAMLLVFLCLVLRRFKISYLFSFLSAVLHGLILDVLIYLLSFAPADHPAFRMTYFVLGLLVGGAGISFLFHTYLAPEVYELFVKEWADKSRWPAGRCKTIYDITSCAVSVLLSFLFFGFGHFEGIKWGTVVCALVNGWLIDRISRILDRHVDFKDGLKLRKYF